MEGLDMLQADMKNGTEDTCAIQYSSGNKTHFIFEGYLYGGIPENLTINAVVWVVSINTFRSYFYIVLYLLTNENFLPINQWEFLLQLR